MIQIAPDQQINAEALYSALMQRRTMAPAFKLQLPYTYSQVLTMLVTACRAEVNFRGRQFRLTDNFRHRLSEIAGWLTDNGSHRGLYICGNVGNGKSTIICALQRLVQYLNGAVCQSLSASSPRRGFAVVSAKDLVKLAKIASQKSASDSDEAARYDYLRNCEVLAIDDLGKEPRESMYYGDFVTAAIDIVEHRYNRLLCTLVTSNLAPDEIAEYYDERTADRFRETMRVINFGNEPSFRRM